MDKILIEIAKLIEKNRKQYLPNVKESDLEENAAVFYMNSKDGTEFEWYVNEKFPPFMVFYDDQDKMGAVKLTLYKDGKVSLLIYDDNGKNLVQEISAQIEAREEDLLKLAVILRNEAEDRGKWDANIESINTDIDASNQMIDEFLSHRSRHDELINMRKILNLGVPVSRKIVDEGWKVGFMVRGEPNNPMDSGWLFFAGDEDDEYNADVNHFEIMSVGYVCNYLDRDIFKYIGMPIGTKLVRISETELEIDDGKKGILMVKR